MAKIVLVQAKVGGKESKPFKMYMTDDVTLPKQFVLRIDPAEDLQNGDEAVKINNVNVKLIATHSKVYIEDLLKGFRYKQDDVVYIIASQLVDEMPQISTLKGSEPF